MPFSCSARATILTQGLSLLIAGLFLLAVASPAVAQSGRTGDNFYGKLGVGVSDYTGEFPAQNDSHPFDLQELRRGSGIPLVVVGEVGYQFSPRWDLALGFQGGNYPIVGYSGGPNGISDSYRFAPQLLGRYRFAWLHQNVSPYVDVGVNATFGGDSPPTSTGFGPSVGGGVEILLSTALSFYVESRFNATFPDDAIDGAGSRNGFDLTGQLLGVGLKVSFPRPTPPRIIQIDGPAEAKAGTSVTFVATVSEQEADSPLTYRWDFGDGERASGLTATHTYDRPGSYEVSFTASNKAGKASRSITVAARPPSNPPQITAVTAVPDSVPVGNPVQFLSGAEGSGDLTYEWSFDDGASATGPFPSHTYDAPGEYSPRLRVSNEAGTVARAVTVRVARPSAQQAGQKGAAQKEKAEERWGIVVTSMRTESRAQTVAQRYGERFSSASMPVRIVETETDRGLRYRVVIGEFESKEAVREAVTEHQENLPPMQWTSRLE